MTSLSFGELGGGSGTGLSFGELDIGRGSGLSFGELGGGRGAGLSFGQLDGLLSRIVFLVLSFGELVVVGKDCDLGSWIRVAVGQSETKPSCSNTNC